MSQIEDNFYKNIKEFKAKAIGKFKTKSIKSLDELVDIFISLKITQDKDEAKQFLKETYVGIGKDIPYNHKRLVLRFSRIFDKEGNLKIQLVDKDTIELSPHSLYLQKITKEHNALQDIIKYGPNYSSISY